MITTTTTIHTHKAKYFFSFDPSYDLDFLFYIIFVVPLYIIFVDSIFSFKFSFLLVIKIIF